MSLGTGITITDDVVVVVEVMWVMLLGVVGILMFVIVYLGSVNVYDENMVDVVVVLYGYDVNGV